MFSRDGSGVVGAADSVCVVVLYVNAASASERVFGVRPDGVPGVNVPLEGGRSVAESASPMMIMYAAEMRGWRFCREIGCQKQVIVRSRLSCMQPAVGVLSGSYDELFGFTCTN